MSQNLEPYNNVLKPYTRSADALYMFVELITDELNIMSR
jgi:hypothetical protein